MKRLKFVLYLAIFLSFCITLAGCSSRNTNRSSESDSLTQQEESSQIKEEPYADNVDHLSSQEVVKTEPDSGVEVNGSQSSSEITIPSPSAVAYQKRYPGEPSGMIQFYVIDSQGNPVQNARLGFTSAEVYAEAEQLDTEIETAYGPSEDFAVRINAFGIAEAGLIEYDSISGQVLKGLPQDMKVCITQRREDGTTIDSTQWVTLTWENTVPSYTIQIDQPNAYASYVEAEDRVQIALVKKGEPAANVFVKLRNQNQKETPDFGGLWLDSYTGFTDQRGTLYLTKIPDGNYEVCAGTIGKQYVGATIEIFEQNRRFELEIK